MKLKCGFLFLALSVSLLAQQDTSEFIALKSRQDFAKAIKEKKDNPDAVLGKLKGQASPTGLKIDKDADFALAAIDLGQRLLALGDAESAEKFFREAVKSLDQAIKRTPDSAPREKAVLLQKRAFLKSRFLNSPKEAKSDLDGALLLRPDDPQLKREKERMGSEHGPDFAEKPKKD